MRKRKTVRQLEESVVAARKQGLALAQGVHRGERLGLGAQAVRIAVLAVGKGMTKHSAEAAAAAEVGYHSAEDRGE